MKMKAGGWVFVLLLFGGVAAGSLWIGQHAVPVIAVVPETTAQEIWESEHVGVEQVARQLAWKVYWNAPVREDDFQRQIRLVEQSTVRKVDGLILAPDHAVALISPVRNAVAHHIPTVIVASPLAIAPGNGLSYVLNDESAMGRIGAQRAARFFKDGDTAVVLGVNPGLIASVERAEAFESTLRALRPGIQIQERSIRSDSPAEAEEDAEDAIRSQPHLRVIFALNVYQSRAALAMLNAHGLLHKVEVIACDQDLDIVFHLRSGAIDTLLAQDTRSMGAIAMHAIEAMRKGEHVEPRQMVQPVMITRDNVDSEAVQTALSVDWRAGA
ncbi:MAG: substrate-binding domain-containing protein [Acidobacteriaceae bacterium]|nr:substrate-binding domain-containing protein [Acidobacteriaceae bacterium]